MSESFIQGPENICSCLREGGILRVTIGKRRFGERHMWLNATTTTIASDGNNQLVSYDYVVLHSNITNLIIIAPGDYVTYI